MNRNFFETKALVDRLCDAAISRKKSVTFLVGSPLSKPTHNGEHGVPGTSEIVNLIREEFNDSEVLREFDEYVSVGNSSQYQKAFEFLNGRRGQDTANKVIRKAIWQAIDSENWPHELSKVSAEDADRTVCRRLEDLKSAWKIPTAMEIFSKLIVNYFDPFGETVLTTNFDPLIEISIANNGGKFFKTILQKDGDIGQTTAEGTHVIHLHGYWYSGDTLHTEMQLTQPRPNLVNSLKKVIDESILVVVGYSGWDDVITNTLADILSNTDRNPEILWGFHNTNAAQIEMHNRKLLSTLGPGIGRGRVSLYKGVDCLELFSETYERMRNLRPLEIASTTDLGFVTKVDEKLADDSGRRELQIQINIPILSQISAEPDRPLFVENWVGRNFELGILATMNSPTVFVTGIGGQGKSALAGRFLQQQAEAPGARFEIWDWRDCKEESDRLVTQMLRIVERLSNGAIEVGQIEVSDIRAVAGILFRVLGEKSALLVFDNVDQYVDLETLRPIRGLDVLISEAQARRHNSLFLFTCRPDVQVDEARATRISLSGLNVEETTELISAYGIEESEQSLALELHETTKGHPLWISLIAMQAIRMAEGLQEVLEGIRKGNATLPDTTRTIWRALNEQQKAVLRTMAELGRSETENRLLDLIPGINANRVNRAQKTLRSFHLVESRTNPKGEALLGLHPIIREFIRANFPRRERELYVGKILQFLDKYIARFKEFLPKDPSYEILEHWVRKAELQISIGRFEDATNTILEITSPLMNRGYSEELIRLGRLLFENADWPEACVSYKNFDSVFRICLREMVEFGDADVHLYLDQYERSILGKGSQYILLSDLRCYSHWYAGNYELAIKWGEEGEVLRNSTAVDTLYTTKHNLALAKRDNGYVNEALESFLEGEQLEQILTKAHRIEGKSAHFYGNIGRCLFLNAQLDEALVCYVKSAQILEEERDESERLNKGYIRYWIGEAMVLNGEYQIAAAVFRAAMLIWHTTSPVREDQAKRKLECIVSKYPELSHYLNEEDWKVESVYKNWLEDQ